MKYPEILNELNLIKSKNNFENRYEIVKKSLKHSRLDIVKSACLKIIKFGNDDQMLDIVRSLSVNRPLIKILLYLVDNEKFIPDEMELLKSLFENRIESHSMELLIYHSKKNNKKYGNLIAGDLINKINSVSDAKDASPLIRVYRTIDSKLSGINTELYNKYKISNV